MTDRDLRLDPERIARDGAILTWPELEQLAREVLGALGLIVESNGAQRRDVAIARAHPGSKPPPVSPMCVCGCPSRRDHWATAIERAGARDLAAGGAPRLVVGAICRAAEDLRLAKRGPRQRPTEADVSDMRGPERVAYILEAWEGLPADRAADLESSRAGHISPSAIRALRHKAGRGRELGEIRRDDDGEPILPDDLFDQVLTKHRMGLADRDIAVELDMAPSTVSLWLKGHRSDESAAA